jgi:2-polyprenyl-3-methyl-5-hydroxy-6-metoxy-1,4-benzoquinol methylase
MKNNNSTNLHCPLCASDSSSFLESVKFSEIWDHLYREWGASFSISTQKAHTPSEFVGLRECNNCHLQYFYPAIEGNKSFYSELASSSTVYYNNEKWEFDIIRKLLNPDDSVADIACGTGAFIKSIQGIVKNVVGLDINPYACEKAAKNEICIHNETIYDFSRKYAEQFSVVCGFQILEHLSKVMPFVRAAYKCVKPGGVLALSVPNRNRRRNPSFGSLDYPPHHLTRWGDDQLSIMSEEIGAQSVEIIKQPMTRMQIIGALRIKELQTIFPRPFYGRDLLIKGVSRALLSFPLSTAFYRLKIHKRMQMWGLSLLAIFKKPFHSDPY